MPFDKHIIGQVPAVIRAHFNVSKLESKRGALGPAAIHSPLPSPLDIPFLLVHWGEPDAETPNPGLDTAGLRSSFISDTEIKKKDESRRRIAFLEK